MNTIITAVILAGGNSTRMKRDKALVKISGKTFIESQIDLLSPIFKNIIVSANKEYNCGVTIINDIKRNTGPISGIYSTLKNIKNNKAFILAVDMPFVKKEIIEELIKQNKDFDITVPVIAGKIQPTCAIYSKKCLKIIEEQINIKDYKLINLLQKCKTNYIEFDTEYLKCFLNINEPNLIT